MRDDLHLILKGKGDHRSNINIFLWLLIISLQSHVWIFNTGEQQLLQTLVFYERRFQRPVYKGCFRSCFLRIQKKHSSNEVLTCLSLSPPASFCLLSSWRGWVLGDISKEKLQHQVCGDNLLRFFLLKGKLESLRLQGNNNIFKSSCSHTFN